jgi:thiol:disulfide interchange protein
LAAWSRQAVLEGQKEGRPVLVDFTAKWCLTCNTLVKPALESASVREKIAQVKAVPLIGDYTGFGADIGEELKRHGRAGVPLVVVFPKEVSKDPIVLPAAITPGMVVDALERAVR